MMAPSSAVRRQSLPVDAEVKKANDRREGPEPEQHEQTDHPRMEYDLSHHLFSALSMLLTVSALSSLVFL